MKLGIRHKSSSSWNTSDVRTSYDEESSLRNCDTASPTKKSPRILRDTRPFPSLVLAVIRKIFYSAITRTTENRVHSRTGCRIANAIKDILLGLVLGVVSISLMLLLDHLNFVHFLRWHQNRTTALASLNNSETLHDFEDTFGLKLIPLDEYDNMLAELKNSGKEIVKLHEELQRQKNELTKKLVKLLPYSDEYEKLITNPLVEIHRFCDNCIWDDSAATCLLHLSKLVNNHNANPLRAKVEIMDSKPHCKK